METSIGVIVRTIGRDTLVNTVASFEATASTNDNILLLFDGVKPTIEASKQVIVKALPKVGQWGHPHAFKALNEQWLKTDYLTFIDDDDEWVEGAFDLLRPQLDGISLVAFPFLQNGIVGDLMYFEERHYIGGLKVAMPNIPPFEWPNLDIDGSLYRTATKRFPMKLFGTPLQRIRVDR